jgi:hypothetical protein
MHVHQAISRFADINGVPLDTAKGFVILAGSRVWRRPLVFMLNIDSPVLINTCIKPHTCLDFFIY